MIEDKIPQTKAAKILSSPWPDIILANKRIAKLKTLAIYEINSITTKKSEIKNGTPLGKKIEKSVQRCTTAPIIVIPKKKDIEINRVIAAELVTVKV